MKLGLFLALCGALLGVANATILPAFVYPDPQFMSTQVGSDFMPLRLLGALPQANDFVLATAVNPSSPTNVEACGTHYTGGYWFLASNFLSTPFGNSQYASSNLAGASSKTSISTESTFSQAGKFRLCVCSGAACNSTAPAADANVGQYNISIGFLHVVDSYYPVSIGKNSGSYFRSAKKILNAGDSSFVSWLFNQDLGPSSKIMVIKDDVFSLSSSVPWNCGSSTYDDNTPIVKIGASADVTSLSSAECAPSGTNASCTSLTIATADIDGTGANDGDTGLLCLCDSALTGGSCTNDADFGIGLGKVRFIQFAASANSNKHYTVGDGTTTVVDFNLQSGEFNKQTPGPGPVFRDRIGLVRLDAGFQPLVTDDAPASSRQPSWDTNPVYLRGNPSKKSYGSSGSTRRCGASNLDPPPVRTPSSTNYAYDLSDTGDISVVVDEFLSARKYMVCWCEATSSQEANSGVFLNQFTCPDIPGTGFPEGASLSSYYAQSLGYLHIVTTLHYPVTLLAQTGAESHFTINFRSSLWDHYVWGNDLSKFNSTRVMFIDATDDCGVGSATTLITYTSSDLYVRVHGTGYSRIEGRILEDDQTYTQQDLVNMTVDDPDYIAPFDLNNPVFATVTSTLGHGSLWSLTSGWPADPHKLSIAGPTGAPSFTKAQSHIGEQGSKITVSAAATDGQSFKICMCDALAEISCAAPYDFGAEIGTLKASKFVMARNAGPKRYLVSKDEASVTLEVSSDDNTYGATQLNDQVAFIPSYGDGLGVDTNSPVPTVGGFADPEGDINARVRPWMTEYFCGHTPISAQRKSGESVTSSVSSWVYGLGPSDVGSSFDVPLSNAPVDKFTEFKICYCSTRFDVGCTTDSVGSGDDPISGFGGWKNAHQFSDFGGYLHIVPYTSATPYYVMVGTKRFGSANFVAGATAAAFGSTTIENVYDNYPTVIRKIADASNFTTAAKKFSVPEGHHYSIIQSGGQCGTSAALTVTASYEFDSKSTYLEEQNGDLVMYTPKAALPANYTACLCNPYLSNIWEKTRTDNRYVDYCNESSTDPGDISAFNYHLADIVGGELITEESDPTTTHHHFTITSALTDQTFNIPYQLDDSSGARTADTFPSGADHIGIMSLSGICGQTAPDFVVPIQEKDSSELTTQLFNYSDQGLAPHTMYKVCYCQAALTQTGSCGVTVNDVATWFQVGFLHVVDMEEWPQQFVIRAGRGNVVNTQGRPFNPFVYVKFANAFNTSWVSNDKFVINGANQYDTSASPGFTTQKCGRPYPGSQAQGDFKTYYKYHTGASDEVSLENPNVLLVDEFNGGTLPSAMGTEGVSAVGVGEFLGVGNYREFCMCDSREQGFPGMSWAQDTSLVSGSPGLKNCPTVTGALTTSRDAFVQNQQFGTTLGRLWASKGFIESDDYASFQHISVRKGSSSFDFTISSVSAATADSVGFIPGLDSDAIAFASPFSVCGLDPLLEQHQVLAADSGNAVMSISSTNSPTLATFDGSSKKIKICGCRFQLFGSCDSTSPINYWTTLAFIHVVDLPGYPFLFTVQRKTTDNIVLSWGSTTNTTDYTEDRFAIILGANNSECGRWSALGIANLEASDFPISPTVAAGFDRYEGTLQAPTNTKGLLSSLPPTVTDTLTVNSPDFIIDTSLDTQWVVCYCSKFSEGTDCPSSALLNDPSRVPHVYYASYGITLGSLFTGVFLTSGSQNQHISVFKGVGSGQSFSVLVTLDITTTVLATGSKFALVPEDQTCGVDDPSALAVGDGALAIIPGVNFTFSGCPTGGCLRTATTNTFDPSSLDIGTYKLCICSLDFAQSTTVVPAPNNTCDFTGSSEQIARKYADTAGYLHLLAGSSDLVDQRASVQRGANETFSALFSSTQGVSTDDRLALIGVDDFCGDATEATTVMPLSSPDVSYTVTPLGSTVALSPSAMTQPLAGIFKVCYCAAGQTGLAGSGCPQMNTTSSALYYGVTIATLVVNDIRFLAVDGIYSISVPQLTTASIAFNALSADVMGSGARNVSFIQNDNDCSLMLSTPGAATIKSDNVEITVGSGSTFNTFSFNFASAVASRSMFRLCFIDSDGSPQDIKNFGVFVTDIDANPQAITNEVTTLSISSASSQIITSDILTWVEYSQPCPTSVSVAGPDSTDSQPFTGSSSFDFSLIDTSSTYAASLRLCVIPSAGCSSVECPVMDFHRVTLFVFGSLTVSPSSVSGGSSDAVTFTYEKAFQSGTGGDRVWFQRYVPSSPTACVVPTAATTDSTEAQFAPANTFSASFNFSYGALPELTQEVWRLCVETQLAVTGTNSIVDFYPVGVYRLDIVVSPSTVQLASSELAFSIDQTLGANPTVLSSLRVGDFIWFQAATSACGTRPTSATTQSTDALSVTSQPTVDYTFDFSQISESYVVNRTSLRLCIDPILTNDVIDAAHVTVQPISVSITNAKSVRGVTSGGQQSLILEYSAGSMNVGDDIWFVTAASSCTPRPAGRTSTNTGVVNVVASGEAVLIEFPDTPGTNFFRLCYRDVTTNEIFDYSGVGVRISSVVAFPTSVLQATGQQIQLSRAVSTNQNEFVATDSIKFVRSDIACPVNLVDSDTGFESTSLSVDVNTIINGSASSTSSCPTGVSTTVFGASRVCDWRCTSGECWFGDFDFSGSTVSLLPYRPCVFRIVNSDVFDWDTTKVYVIDLSIRPASNIITAPTTITFFGHGFSGAPSDQTLRDQEKIWFAAKGDCDELPAFNDRTSSVESYNSTSQSAEFTFTNTLLPSPTLDGLSLCATADDTTFREYSNIFRRADFNASTQFVLAGESSSEITIQWFSVESAMTPINGQNGGFASANNITTGADFLFFLSQTETCESALPTTKVGIHTALNGSSFSASTSATRSTVVPWNQTSAPTPGSDALTFSFENISATTVPFRLCIVRFPDEERKDDGLTHMVLDFSHVSVAVSDVQITTGLVSVASGQRIVMSSTVGIDSGDVIFFRDTAGPACGATVPTDGPQFLYTDAFTVPTPQNSNPLSFELDFSRATIGSEYAMCKFSSQNGMLSFTSVSVKVTDTGLTPQVVRQENTNITITETAGFINSTVDTVFFIDSSLTCAVLSNSINSTTSGTPVTLATPLLFDFTQVRPSNVLMRLCVRDVTSNTFIDYKSLGVIVTDLKIGGSDSVSASSCVSPSSAQRITFTSVNPFDYNDRLFFVRITEPCDSVPSASSTLTSDAVYMITLKTGVTTWTLDFDFSNSAVDPQPYRLCADIGGTGLNLVDYQPLGVRVTTAAAKGVTASGTIMNGNGVAPLANQRVQITAANSITPNSLIWFVTDSVNANGDRTVTCECSRSNTCAGSVDIFTPTNSIVTDQTLAFDFSPFNQAGAKKRSSDTAVMCVQDPSNNIFEMSCVTTKFGTTVSPASVPANSGQELTLTYDGISVLSGDQLVWRVSGPVSCPADFSTAHTTNPDTYSSAATAGSSGTPVSFDFDNMSSAPTEMSLCVNRSGTVFELSNTITIAQAVVGLEGDPHVRTATGQWMDFFGEAGVYTLSSGSSGIQANAKLGYAVRDNHMIWHPKVMRPGTVVEEVGIRVGDAEVRLAVFGGGVVSIRQGTEKASFWTAAEEQSLTVGDYEIEWTKDCESIVRPWGTHERSNMLSITGKGEFMQLFVAQSGGYRFIDVEASPSGDSGLLVDASKAPLALEATLKQGGEADYKVGVASLLSA